MFEVQFSRARNSQEDVSFVSFGSPDYWGSGFKGSGLEGFSM